MRILLIVAVLVLLLPGVAQAGKSTWLTGRPNSTVTVPYMNPAIRRSYNYRPNRGYYQIPSVMRYYYYRPVPNTRVFTPTFPVPFRSR